jgi:hypothetical protein
MHHIIIHIISGIYFISFVEKSKLLDYLQIMPVIVERISAVFGRQQTEYMDMHRYKNVISGYMRTSVRR